MPYALEPPVALPPGCVVHVPGRGELFVRDSGGEGPPLLLLHGWTLSADLNWFRAYGPLVEAGYRVLALDHRGHGRGLRSAEAFTLRACADDAAALLEHLEVEPALVCGYSMGGPIAKLLARHHPERVSALVLCATANDWSDPRMKAFWRVMGGLRLLLGVAPNAAWRRGLQAAGFPDSPVTGWIVAELSRGSARAIAEAGRELGRFDSREWAASLDFPAAVIVTTKDTGVPPDKQRALAVSLRAPMFEVDGDHAAVIARYEEFNVQLLRALESLRSAEQQVQPV
jgi:pimeloyl-ACP methyl ester carboxylesterase